MNNNKKTYETLYPSCLTEEDVIKAVCKKFNVSKKCFSFKFKGEDIDSGTLSSINNNPGWNISNTWKWGSLTGSPDLINRVITLDMAS